MSSHPLPEASLGQSLKSMHIPARARIALKVMQKLRHGSLTVVLPNGESRRFGDGLPHAEIILHNWKVCDESLRHGDIGFGETYINEDWSTPNVATLMDVMVRNRNDIEAVVYGTWWGKLLARMKHLLNSNTRKGSKKNIQAHYDIGNDFYKLWLDGGMTYSSALFATEEGAADDLEILPAAQERKYQRILAQLGLPEGARVLEIGCGWGGFAEQAARLGLHVTGLTLSQEQLAFARARLDGAGLADRVDLKLLDYRDARGEFDGIASIEMFEAVGEAFWPSYFECLAQRLKRGGRAVIQTITICDTLFETYRKSTDFIQQYIFPGGMLPSPSVFRAHAERAGLTVVDSFAFGQDYARTLHAWLRNFYTNERAIRAQRFDTRFLRTWAFYLAYCEAAFRHHNTDVTQFTLEKV